MWGVGGNRESRWIPEKVDQEGTGRSWSDPNPPESIHTAISAGTHSTFVLRGSAFDQLGVFLLGLQALLIHFYYHFSNLSIFFPQLLYKSRCYSFPLFFRFHKTSAFPTVDKK